MSLSEKELSELCNLIVCKVRKFIPYSTNLPFFLVENNDNPIHQTQVQINAPSCSWNTPLVIRKELSALSSLLCGVGDCTEQSKVILTLFKLINIPNLNNYRCDIVRINEWTHHFNILYPEQYTKDIHESLSKLAMDKKVSFPNWITSIANKPYDVWILDGWIKLGCKIDNTILGKISSKVSKLQPLNNSLFGKQDLVYLEDTTKVINDNERGIKLHNQDQEYRNRFLDAFSPLIDELLNSSLFLSQIDYRNSMRQSSIGRYMNNENTIYDNKPYTQMGKFNDLNYTPITLNYKKIQVDLMYFFVKELIAATSFWMNYFSSESKKDHLIKYKIFYEQNKSRSFQLNIIEGHLSNILAICLSERTIKNNDNYSYSIQTKSGNKALSLLNSQRFIDLKNILTKSEEKITYDDLRDYVTRTILPMNYSENGFDKNRLYEKTEYLKYKPDWF
ncbi:hypothetical protein EDC55_11936 [Allofrancisella inopinata]|uniref:Uncharacterized protein n=1 Tax=Allofrancisella inopinata TaxID=1085647 RepID=A0AAE7CRL0_9GAMM|nr:hypothetical protein [Allofrancisella inopinata]QIV96479.1 hypothetical protein E4K63_06400 [Allofrancisella inopinata]TDT68689.1 hypothetical protein EDC55_11936 [Allofrancisella inopinata]